MYDLSGGLNTTEWEGDEVDGSAGGGGGNIPESFTAEPILTATEFMYTAKTGFGEAAMNQVVRQPDFTPVLSDTMIQAQLEVRFKPLMHCVLASTVLLLLPSLGLVVSTHRWFLRTLTCRMNQFCFTPVCNLALWSFRH